MSTLASPAQLQLFDVEHPPLIDEVPLCACGCGRAVQLASANDKRTGAVRGKPLRFIRGHHAHGRPFIRPPQYVEVDTGYTTPCHLWGAKVCHWGYGVLRSGMTGKTYRAHRAIYEAFVRPLGPKEVLDHLCRQKTCVNVEHLEPVPQRTKQRGQAHGRCGTGYSGKHTQPRAAGPELRRESDHHLRHSHRT